MNPGIAVMPRSVDRGEPCGRSRARCDRRDAAAANHDGAALDHAAVADDDVRVRDDEILPQRRRRDDAREQYDGELLHVFPQTFSEANRNLDEKPYRVHLRLRPLHPRPLYFGQPRHKDKALMKRDVGEQLVRPQARGLIVNRRGDDELVGAGSLHQLRQLLAHRRRRPDQRTRQHARRVRLLGRRPKGFDVVDRRLQAAARAAQ